MEIYQANVKIVGLFYHNFILKDWIRRKKLFLRYSVAFRGNITHAFSMKVYYMR